MNHTCKGNPSHRAHLSQQLAPPTVVEVVDQGLSATPLAFGQPPLLGPRRSGDRARKACRRGSRLSMRCKKASVSWRLEASPRRRTCTASLRLRFVNSTRWHHSRDYSPSPSGYSKTGGTRNWFPSTSGALLNKSSTLKPGLTLSGRSTVFGGSTLDVGGYRWCPVPASALHDPKYWLFAPGNALSPPQ